jgi:hypothetical protein
MKKIIALGLLSGIILLGCETKEAEAMDWTSDITVSNNNVTFAYDQDGDEWSIGTGPLTFSTSNSVDVGIEYTPTLPIWSAGLGASVTYEYTSDEENVLGVNAELGYLGANVETSITWNIDDSDFDAKIGTGYEILGLDGSITSNWDLDDFAYQGLDTEVGYTWKVSENFSVRPNITVPLDDDWNRGDLVAGVAIRVSFGSD